METVDGLLAVAFTTWEISLMTLTLLITMISGYLVIAYAVGREMTRSQVAIVNFLYLFMSISTLWSLVVISSRAAAFEDMAYAMSSGAVGDLQSRGDMAALIIGAYTLAISASLKFMWDVRHKRPIRSESKPKGY